MKTIYPKATWSELTPAHWHHIAAGLALTTCMLTATQAAAQSEPNTFCTGPIIGGTFRNIVVPSGATCKLSGVHATGSVKVEPGGALQLYVGTTSGNTIDGNVQADGARWIVSGWQPGNTIAGSVQIRGTMGVQLGDTTADHQASINYFCRTTIGDSVQIEDGATNARFNVGSFAVPDPIAPCTAINHIGGSIRTDSNAGELWIGNNEVGWNVLVRENNSVHVNDNTIVGNLRCDSNDAIDGAGNTAADKKGQCAGF